MERFGKKEDTESYRRWERKYYVGRKWGKSKKSSKKHIEKLSNATSYTMSSRTQRSRTLWRARTRGVPFNQRLAGRIRKLERGISGAEWKTHDVAASAQDMTDAGQITCLSAIAQGDTSLTREGLKIRLMSMDFRCEVLSDTTNVDEVLCRIMIFSDQQQHGTVPTVAEVLESASPLAFREHENNPRFITIMDKQFHVQPVMAGRRGYFKKKYKKFGGRKLFYIGTSAAAASMGKGQLYVLFISDKTTADYPVLNYNCRLKFTDI